MSTAYHMPLVERKIFSGRLIFIEAAEPFSSAFSQQGKEGLTAFATFRHGYFEKLREEIENQPPNTPLDVFLASVLTSYKASSSTTPLAKYPALFDQLWDEMEKTARHISCEQCVRHCGAANSDVCDDDRNNAHNHELVDQGGFCIKSVRAMFELASKTARLLYDNSCSHASVTFPAVLFSTLEYGKPGQLHSLPIKFVVRGETRFSNAGKLSQIELGFAPDYFDYETFTAIPYVLFHECIAHAFYSVLPTLANRPKVKDDDMFYEGWMDYAAFKVTETVLSEGQRWRDVSGIPVTPSNQKIVLKVEAYVRDLTEKVGDPQVFLDSATAFHQARYRNPDDHLTDQDLRASIRVTEATRRADSLRQGVRAANKFLKFLDVQFPAFNPLALFLRISCELNMLARLDQERRWAFVTLMNDLPGDGFIRLPRHEEVYNIVRAYLEQANIENLMECCYTLKQHLARK